MSSTDLALWAIAVLVAATLVAAVLAWRRDMRRNREERACVTTAESGQEASATSDPTSGSAGTVRRLSTAGSASPTRSTDYCGATFEPTDHVHLTCLRPAGHGGAHRATHHSQDGDEYTTWWARWEDK